MPKRFRSAGVALATAILVAVSLAVGGCDQRPETVGHDDDTRVTAEGAGPRITYPQNGTLFPPEIVSPTVTWEDEAAGPWELVVRDDRGEEIVRESVTEPRWRPSKDVWRDVKARSTERDAELSVTRAGRSSRVRIRTSKDPVGDSLFYREVPLPFLKAVQDPAKIRWRYGSIDMEEGPPIVLQNLPVCGNCHSFSDDASVLGLDVDYGNDKGAYAVMPVSTHMILDDAKIITWADYRREDDELTFGLLSRVSPTGRYVVSTVKDRSVFVAMPDLMISQLFFPIKGILVVYDREAGTYSALPGAADPAYVQSNPVWSPDGASIVFARAKAYHAERLDQKNSALVDEKDVPEFTIDNKPFQYDLYRVPFNGGKGGVAEPLAGASNNGRSNFFPKYSPDGKWIVFCQAENYMLLRPDSELYIVPAAGGEARRLRYNTARMNSWHSWSSNSRWLVFSSKVNGPYTQLFLTHIDDDGNDSPPVLLERFTAPDRAGNIPEFVRLPGDAIAEIREQFLDAYSFLRAGTANENTGDHVGAERAFRRGLEIAPDDVELRNALGWTLFQSARTEEAVAEYERALTVDPDHVKSHNNLALALVELGRLEEAAEHFGRSLALEPAAEIYSDRGFIMARLGRTTEALADYRAALALDPDCASAHQNLAVSFVQSGDLRRAEKHYRRALAVRPTPEAHNGLGFVLARQGKSVQAIDEYRRATEAAPGFVGAYNNLAEALVQVGRPAEAAAAYRKSLSLQPNPAVERALRELGGGGTEGGRAAMGENG